MKAKKFIQNIAAYGSILFFLVMALEVMIMISPFAFFFYSVFSPVFNFLGQHAATRWTTMFFLPHMILPPTLFLKTVRILGSVLFLTGFVVFIICASQVYLGKIFKWGIAHRGIYKYIRHPQYLSLGIWGVGMAILWPRFIVLATLSLMFILYYFLAKDEERRMLSEHQESYELYMHRTGRSLPRAVEEPLASLFQPVIPASPWKYAVVPALIITSVLGTGFLLREISLRSLLFAARQNIHLVPILPEDGQAGAMALTGIMAGVASGQAAFLQPDKEYLGYLMPVDYVMQGMIADTGEHFHLFKKHQTVGLILDWVFHPFDHLRRPPAAHMAAMHQVDAQTARRHHCPLELNRPDRECGTCTFRRVVLVEVGHGSPSTSRDLLSMQTERTPVGVIDLDVLTGEVVKAKRVNRGSAWKDVPTPEI